MIDFDTNLFQVINSDLANPVFDVILKWIRHPLFWVPFYTFIIAFIFMNLPVKKAWILFGFILLNGMCTDFMSSTLIKKSVQRVRPCNDPGMQDNIRVLVRCGSGYSFTSSHATNHFGVATFLFLTLGAFGKWFRWPLIFWAGVISFAQVYVGVHYPIDVLAGALLGVLVARVVHGVYLRYWGGIDVILNMK